MVTKIEKFNILNHELVPEHIILKDDEKDVLLKSFNISEKNLPKISSSDPVVKLIGANPGDILKIIRKSQTAKTTNYYRFVVRGD